MNTIVGIYLIYRRATIEAAKLVVSAGPEAGPSIANFAGHAVLAARAIGIY